MKNELDELKIACSNCRRCLVGGREIDGKPANVFSNMNLGADIMVVGQNPGLEEVAAGEPFVGESGRRFKELMKEIAGVSEDRLYLCNLVRCFMPGFRRPCQNEMDNCGSYLDREVEIIDPKIIIALGRPTMKQLTGFSGGIIRHCGEIIFSPKYKKNVLILLHPSPRNMDTEDSRKMIEVGLVRLRGYLDGR